METLVTHAKAIEKHQYGVRKTVFRYSVSERKFVKTNFLPNEAKYTLSYKSLISYFSSSHAKIAVCPGDNERNSLSLVRLMKSSTFDLGLNLLEVRVENQFLCKETKNSFSGLRQESSF